MKPLTMFTWGYWGWGTATAQLIRAVDAVEASHGYRPPMFVDIRLSRSVRAPGFNGKAFEKALGSSRYRWLNDLGNLGINDGGPMRIKNPAAAKILLDIAIASSRSRQRILFFCSCEWPGTEANGCCHRVVVAQLVLKAAELRNLDLQIAEWPGGEPKKAGIHVPLSKVDFAKFARGATSIPLPKPVVLPEMAALPWLSPVTAYEKGNDEETPLMVLGMPARYVRNKWQIPIFGDISESVSDSQLPKHIETLRKRLGFCYRQTRRR